MLSRCDLIVQAAYMKKKIGSRAVSGKETFGSSQRVFGSDHRAIDSGQRAFGSVQKSLKIKIHEKCVLSLKKKLVKENLLKCDCAVCSAPLPPKKAH